MAQYTVEPIGKVHSDFAETDDRTGSLLRNQPATIKIFESYRDALTNFDKRIGAEEEILLEVIFIFDGIDDDEIKLASESSKGLTPAGVGGVFTRRTPRRPNKLGLTTVRVVERNGLQLHVKGLDALDGTPVLDLKPHINWKDHLD